MNSLDIDKIRNFFFIGIAGVGMSAIAQYLKGTGKQVCGSDRQFKGEEKHETEIQLNAEGIVTFPQNGSGLGPEIELCVVSTAVEQDNPEIRKAKSLDIPVVHRADLLAAICESKRTVAVAGTSGKSTTAAMIYHIMEQCGKPVSFMSGAGLVALQEQGKMGNGIASQSEWLVIEADESDGSLVKYHPEIGLILNIEKDHKEIEELESIFRTFKDNIQGKIIVNRSHERAAKFSHCQEDDFGLGVECGFRAEGFRQDDFCILFKINNIDFEIPTIGKHNVENAAAAVAVCTHMGVTVQQASEALKTYKGIYRRHQLIGKVNGFTVIDDYAHNPVKLAASIRACQFEGSKLIVWFQPHGFAPTKFLRNEFVSEIQKALRPQDEIWMSEIYYAGGTVNKDISANDLIEDIKREHPHAWFLQNRDSLADKLRNRAEKGDIILLTGARDPSLGEFAKSILMKIRHQS